MRATAALLLLFLLETGIRAEEEEPAPRAEKVKEWSLPKANRSAEVRLGPTGRWLLVSWTVPGVNLNWTRFRLYSLPDARLAMDGPQDCSGPPAIDRLGRFLAYGVPKQGFEVHVLDLHARTETTSLLPPQGGAGGLPKLPAVCGISADGRYVAIHGIGPLLRTGESLDSLAIYDLKSMKPVVRPDNFAIPYQGGRAATFGDGSALYHTRSPGKGGRRDVRLRVLDLANGQLIFDLPTRVFDTVLRPAISPDGRYIYSGDSKYRVRRYELTTGRERSLFVCPKEQFKYLLAVTLSSNGLRLAAWSGPRQPILFYDLEAGERFDFDPGPKRWRLLGLSADGRYAWLATSVEVGVYDIEERKWRAPLLTEHVPTAQIDPTGQWLVTQVKSESGPRLTLYRIK